MSKTVIYFEVAAGTEKDPGMLLTWGWGDYASAQEVGCAILGKTLNEAFWLLGADGKGKFEIGSTSSHPTWNTTPMSPCVTADGPDDAVLDRFMVVKQAYDDNDSGDYNDRTLAEITTKLRSTP